MDNCQEAEVNGGQMTCPNFGFYILRVTFVAILNMQITRCNKLCSNELKYYRIIQNMFDMLTT